ncbi:Baeyer-Villiger monooxygenase [Paramyrothecium foliicola]|nr:Baeyer-Villiger monooxygenase [Paramyrothecium foliicola]
MARPKTIIIGGGAAGIAMAHTLKWKLGYSDFMIYDKREGLGGTWLANTYPGCGSDVPIHLYSFSFNLNPDWTQQLADQEEILRYMESTVDKFGLRPHFKFNSECLKAKWIDGQWHVTFIDSTTNQISVKTCEILLSAVGGFSQPREAKFPGLDRFKGKIFHTAEWDHTFSLKDKRVAVIGNGCSAAQVVPCIATQVQQLTQFARSPQWYHERPNRGFTNFEKFCFRYVPFLQRYYRLDLFLKTDQLAAVYGPNETQKYHNFIVPNFPLGCKRRIYDPGYLASLHRDNVELVPEGIKEFTETGMISESGKETEFDAAILATGFAVTSFLAPMEIIGKNGRSLRSQWDSHRGAQAYMGTFVHNFPNLAILFGPNTFPAFNSVIYSVEVQVSYTANVLIKPILDSYAAVVEVKQTAEESFVQQLDNVLSETVFAASCSNWYINSAGRNSAAWPGLAWTFWKATLLPKWNHFAMTGGSRLWMFRKIWRKITTTSVFTWVALILAIFIAKGL